MFGKGNSSVTLEEILSTVTEAEILYFYLGIREVPCVICSPLRKDNKPSFGLYSNDGSRIYYSDLATKSKGGLFDLLEEMWGCSFGEVLKRIYNDMPEFKNGTKVKAYTPTKVSTYKNYSSNSTLSCKVREWRQYDIDYWESYGVPLKWLKYAEVYPISHKIIQKDSHTYTLPADKYAYAFVEHKEGNTTLKIYQPFNKNGYKWSNKHDRSVISLWSKLPKDGDRVCICSSLKDALCLWANAGVPSVAIQGEGYDVSDTVIKLLKDRFKYVYIMLDNDKPGLEDAEKLAKRTGFKNIVLPQFEGGKDVSDYYKSLTNKAKFKKLINLFYSQENGQKRTL